MQVRIFPFPGIEVGKIQSKALILSDAIKIRESPTSYMSRTLPWRQFILGKSDLIKEFNPRSFFKLLRELTFSSKIMFCFPVNKGIEWNWFPDSIWAAFTIRKARYSFRGTNISQLRITFASKAFLNCDPFFRILPNPHHRLSFWEVEIEVALDMAGIFLNWLKQPIMNLSPHLFIYLKTACPLYLNFPALSFLHALALVLVKPLN